jgi:hypothetical protein
MARKAERVRENDADASLHVLLLQPHARAGIPVELKIHISGKSNKIVTCTE